MPRNKFIIVSVYITKQKQKVNEIGIQRKKLEVYGHTQKNRRELNRREQGINELGNRGGGTKQ